MQELQCVKLQLLIKTGTAANIFLKGDIWFSSSSGREGDVALPNAGDMEDLQGKRF